MIMPSFEHGLIKAMSDLLIGFVAYFAIQTIADQYIGQLSGLITFILMIFSIIALIELLDRMNHWSLVYLAGWMLGIWFLGPYLTSWWEMWVPLIVGVGYAGIKISRKV